MRAPQLRRCSVLAYAEALRRALGSGKMGTGWLLFQNRPPFISSTCSLGGHDLLGVPPSERLAERRPGVGQQQVRRQPRRSGGGGGAGVHLPPPGVWVLLVGGKCRPFPPHVEEWKIGHMISHEVWSRSPAAYGSIGFLRQLPLAQLRPGLLGRECLPGWGGVLRPQRCAELRRLISFNRGTGQLLTIFLVSFLPLGGGRECRGQAVEATQQATTSLFFCQPESKPLSTGCGREKGEALATLLLCGLHTHVCSGLFISFRRIKRFAFCRRSFCWGGPALLLLANTESDGSV